MAKEGEREHRSENNDKKKSERSRFYSKGLNLNYFASAIRFSQFSTENLV